ncbi:MAG TPA: sigma-70 family RNA polymerase sigma factor [Pyrinomonadaceae bacterium]|nr:sigma-70 family RNA polymerase sigma factor [Pyrinomonadaceae bacterium]
MEQTVAMSERRIGEHIISACRQGDRDAFRLLFEAYKDRVYSVALYFFGGDETTAGDITQQVFLKLFTKITQFREESEFTTWLYRLATNECVDEHRKRRRFLPFAGEDAAPRRPPARRPQEDSFARAEVAGDVQRAVAALKPKLRVAILLKYFEELSYEEIARVLGCSKGTVASRLNRGHKILARRLGHLRGPVFGGE